MIAHAKHRNVAFIARVATLLGLVLLACVACGKKPSDPRVRKMASVLDKRIASVKSFDISYVTTGTALSDEETGQRRVVYKSGRYVVRGFLVGYQAGRIRSQRHWFRRLGVSLGVMKPPAPTPLAYAETEVRHYWTLFLALPKNVPVDDNRRPYYFMSERLASGKGKVVKESEIVDGHECLLIEYGSEFVWNEFLWLDADELVVRCRALWRRGDSDYVSLHLRDYRPLEGSRLSIPWRVERRNVVKSSAQPTPATVLSAPPAVKIECIKVTRARANRGVRLPR
jgi:hypothetical protein